MSVSEPRFFDAHLFDIDGCLASAEFNERYQLLLEKLLQHREQWFLECLSAQLTDEEKQAAIPTADVLNKILTLEADFQKTLYTEFEDCRKPDTGYDFVLTVNAVFPALIDDTLRQNLPPPVVSTSVYRTDEDTVASIPPLTPLREFKLKRRGSATASTTTTVAPPPPTTDPAELALKLSTQ